MSIKLLWAVGAIADVVWAVRRLHFAWSQGYVLEVDDPHFGHELGRMSRRERPWRFSISVTITTFLLLVVSVFLIWLIADAI
ncbi:hypothetical protein [Porphyrobacter sp. YT40]|uniref:hypothetical protein n=1 Tax=Porphyrobacter sp. YT40 TaxID=2547601 RepID=UPI0011447AF6|nr:hypothetical protein [Porphyrobacter sp. YT40]QDH35189.1 hypothetical protein E2E27_13185 [Porphyrobacter sp. YT40]